MRIDKLTMKNFCCFENREFYLAESFNLLIGDNGSGKTSILDALAVGLGSLFLGLTESTVARPIHKNEVRVRSYLQGETYTRENQFPVIVSCEGSVHEMIGVWGRELNALDGRTTRQNAVWIENIAASLDGQVRTGQGVVLPVISYYGTGRLWLQKRQKSVDPLQPGSRFLGYLDCLDPYSDEKRLLAWFKTQEIQSIQEKKPIAVLEAVRKAILTCVENSTHVWYNVAQDELLLRFADREIPFEYLSDGYRNMLAMIADIAVRCATLNPALKEDAISKTPGVVLIDEIDLHLHPKWQRRIANDLQAAFPMIQFVSTTHSPFIIQSLTPKEGVQLLNLDNPEANDFAHKSVEDIAEDVQGVEVPQRSRRFLNMMQAAEKYYGKLREGQAKNGDELDRIRNELDVLMLPFSDDPAYQAFLNMKRAASGIDGGSGHAAS